MPLKVGIVNDMKLATAVLRKVVTADPALSVCWTAADGLEAVAQCAAELPDSVLMDLVMPKLDGAEATRRIMARTPCPILIVTSTVDGHLPMVYEAMGGGAVDVTTTPVVGDQRMADDGLLLRRKIISVCARHQPARLRTRPMDAASPLPVQLVPHRPLRVSTSAGLPLLAIGASTGGPAALATILQDLPDDFPAGIVIVQHIDSAFAEGLAHWLNSRTALKVSIAGQGESLQCGQVYIAGTGDHLLMDVKGALQYVSEPSDSIHRPSIDLFLHSAAQHAAPGSCGVLLTGMGRDGAAGLLAMREAGFMTLAQDQASSVVYGMPRAAAELNAVTRVLPLTDMAHHLKSAFKEAISS